MTTDNITLLIVCIIVFVGITFLSIMLQKSRTPEQPWEPDPPISPLPITPEKLTEKIKKRSMARCGCGAHIGILAVLCIAYGLIGGTWLFFNGEPDEWIDGIIAVIAGIILLITAALLMDSAGPVKFGGTKKIIHTMAAPFKKLACPIKITIEINSKKLGK